MRISIVVPTYNEKENISSLLSEIFSLKIKGLSVLVVDDNSPDGTGDLAEELKRRYPRLEVLHREKKEGLGRAYMAGFQKALSEGADIIFEMDADFSHDPKYIPKFLEAIKDDDLVLGSRYVHGGGIENWNWARRTISRLGNFYARTLLRIPIRDLTGGYKCYRRKVLEELNFDSLSSIGYNFQIETTYLAYRKGFSIKEIPILFVERKEGKSKFNAKIIFESFWKVLLLKIKYPL